MNEDEQAQEEEQGHGELVEPQAPAEVTPAEPEPAEEDES